MKHYKDENNNFFGYEDGDIIPVGLIEVTIDEINTYNKEKYEASLTYAEKRELEYPPIAKQMDMQYHDLINGTTVWKDTIEAIKAKYPKP